MELAGGLAAPGAPGTTAILAPALRNGRREDQHVNRSARTASLFDVTAASLCALPEAADPDRLRRVVRLPLDGIELEAIW